MKTADHFATCVNRNLKLRLEPLRKKDISDLKVFAGQSAAADWLAKIETAKPGTEPVFDGAWKAVTIRGTEAIVWVNDDSFDQYSCYVRVVSLMPVEANIDFWLDLIAFIHNSKPNNVSITWVLSSEQHIGQEALCRWNYKYVARLRALLPDPEGHIRHDAWMYRTDFLLRPDIGVSFVKFKFGWLAVSGSQKGIRKIEFIRTGSKIKDVIVSVNAQYYGIVDEKGIVKPHEQVTVNIMDDEDIITPEPVIAATDQLESYLAGKQRKFNVDYDLEHFSSFQKRVWDAISNVPYGATSTYEDLAIKIAAPGQRPHTLARAVGTACASNPLPLIVPCHRIIGKDGRLTGFNGGVDIKEYLLNHEMFGLV